MKAYSQTEPATYAVSGDELRIHWDATKLTMKDMDDVEQTTWVANEALALVHDDRKTLIERIIGSQYTLPEEIALINNKDSEPEEYATYQALRQKAKDLADAWLAQKEVAHG